MAINMESYESIKDWKQKCISEFLIDTITLNEFHDAVMRKVFELAIIRVNKRNPDCEFTWFITGSGGRFEQGLISDQDHGIIYEVDNDENQAYFRELGKEISFGLNVVGYPYCQGNVMSSNPLWCKSIKGWKAQLLKWMEEESWESIRNLQIFYDARALMGKDSFVHDLKTVIHDFQMEHPSLLKRFMDNIMYVKNVFGPLGNLIVKDHGIYQGSIDLKYSAFLPYVNAIRLLAIKEGLHETSTIDRINHLIHLNGYGSALGDCDNNFLVLLKYRLSLYNAETYDDTHYLNIKKLNNNEKKEVKRILKNGIKLHQYVCDQIEKGS